MAARISSRKHRIMGVNDPLYNVRVSLPITDNSSKEIRDNILIDFFGYSEGDIKSFNERKSDCYFIIGDPNNPEKWATAADVNSWTLNADRTVPIRIPQKLLDDLKSFRQQRATFEVFKVGMFISDLTLRKNFTDDLESILLSSGEKRLAALDDLVATITTSNAARDELYKALRFLTNEAGYKNDPFLLLATAATTCSRSDNPVFRYPAITEAVIAAAVKAANERLYSDSKNSASTITTQEAARINLWAATLYDSINAADSAAHRRRIERLLSMSDAERGSLRQGDEIGVFEPQENVIRPNTSANQQLNALDENWGKRQQWEQETNQIGNEIPPTDPYYDDYFFKPSDRLDRDQIPIKQKQRIMANGEKRPKFKVGSFSIPVNELGNKPDYLGNPITLLLEEWRYMAADRRMNALADYSDKRRILLKQIRKEQIIVIPPRPEVVRQVIADVRRYGRNSIQPFMKFGVFYVLTDLEDILEESNAFYKVRK